VKKSEYKLPIIIPRRPILSVVDGAARCGNMKGYIIERKLKKTYGISTICPVASCVQKGIPQYFIEQNKRYYQNIQDYRVDNVFSIFVKHNQRIRMDSKPIKQDYTRLHRNQRSVNFKIYTTDEEEPLIIDPNTCTHIMSLEIDFPPYSNDLDCSCEFDFSDTMVRVFAYPASQPNARKEIKFNYEFY